MNELPLAEAGIAITAVGSIVLIVRYFLSHLKEKDKIFTETINNHLEHEMKIKEKHAVAFEGFAKIMERIEKKL